MLKVLGESPTSAHSGAWTRSAAPALLLGPGVCNGSALRSGNSKAFFGASQGHGFKTARAERSREMRGSTRFRQGWGRGGASYCRSYVLVRLFGLPSPPLKGAERLPAVPSGYREEKSLFQRGGSQGVHTGAWFYCRAFKIAS